MTGMKWLKALRRLTRGQRGLLLPTTTLVMTLGTLLLVPLMVLVGTTFTSNRAARERELALYAAEAGVNRVLADLVRGADGISTMYTLEEPHDPGDPDYLTFPQNTNYIVPTVTVNGFDASVTIEDPGVTPDSQQRYIDPGLLHPDMVTIPPGTGYLVRLYHVKQGRLQVNWAYSPAGTAKIGIWQGTPVNPATQQPFTPGRISQYPVETPLTEATSSASDAYVTTPPLLVSPGIYTIVFFNPADPGASTKTSAPFAPTGNSSDTWIWGKVYRDYRITAVAGNFTLWYVVRQVPGYMEPPVGDWSATNVSFTTNEVLVHSRSLVESP